METLKGPQIAGSFFRKKNRARGIRLHVVKLYHNAVVTVPAPRQKQVNGQDSKSRNKPIHYGHLIYDKRDKNIQWGNDSLFNKWCWENWTATCEIIKLGHSITPHSK